LFFFGGVPGNQLFEISYFAVFFSLRRGIRPESSRETGARGGVSPEVAILPVTIHVPKIWGYREACGHAVLRLTWKAVVVLKKGGKKRLGRGQEKNWTSRPLSKIGASRGRRIVASEPDQAGK